MYLESLELPRKLTKPSLAPFSEINIYLESSLCVDIRKKFVPKFPIKNRASTLLRFTEGHSFVTLTALEILSHR